MLPGAGLVPGEPPGAAALYVGGFRARRFVDSCRVPALAANFVSASRARAQGVVTVEESLGLCCTDASCPNLKNAAGGPGDPRGGSSEAEL